MTKAPSKPVSKPKPRPKALQKVIFHLPDTLVVGPFSYTVQLLPEIKAMENGVLGYCDRHENVISIKEGLNPQTTAEVFLHEALHAIFYASGLTHLEDVDKEEEAIVTQMTMGLITVIRQNPDFLPLIIQLLDYKREA